MAYYTSLSDFYRSKEWREFRQYIIAQRIQPDGFVYDEITGKPIVRASDIILHHIQELTLENVNDANVTLNPANIQVVSFKTHNDIHSRFGTWKREVYLVYGCPLSGKTTFVKENAGIHDLIIDTDRIYACISNNPMYIKSGRLYDCKEAVKEALFGCIKRRRGKWQNAFIVGGYPFELERRNLCIEYNAKEIFVECDKDTALSRLASTQDGRDMKEWSKYIDDWFAKYSA